jgi:hypothetical protein
VRNLERAAGANDQGELFSTTPAVVHLPSPEAEAFVCGRRE